MTLQIKQLYSETEGNRPSKEQVDAGQLWINSGDSCIGTKKNDGTVVTYAQLTEAERETARSALTKTVADATYLGKTAKAASATLADKATILATSRNIALSGDVTGNADFNGSTNTTIAATLVDSGVTAGAYGPTNAATLTFGGSVNVPQVTVDEKGRVTKAVHHTIKLPAAPTSVSGNAGTATQLATARTVLTNLSSTNAASFDGTTNITPGVTGTLGIANGGTGATTASAALSNLGGVSTSGGTINGNLTVSGALSGGTLSATSDARLKDIIDVIRDINLSSLSTYRYTFKHDESHREHVGLLAQEVQAILPEAVIDNNGVLSLDYNAVVSILVSKVNRLEEALHDLQVQNTNLLARVESLSGGY